jgi:hypothetical protein
LIGWGGDLGKNPYFPLMKQTVILTILAIGLTGISQAQKVAVLEQIEFDSATSIIGFPTGSKPEQNKQFSFIVKTREDFDRMKADWVFEASSFGKKPDNSLAIYVVKNKVGEWVGTVYPGINKLTTISSSYVFDTLKLVKLAKAHPFHGKKRVELFNNRAECLQAYEKARAEKNYLFSFGPGKWDGNFKVAISSSDSIHTPVAAIDMLQAKFSSLTDEHNFSLRYELSDDNRDYTKSFKITVDCVQSLYEQYNDQAFPKSDWKPERMFMTSFWQESQ